MFGLSQISAFEDKIFKQGPPEDKACPILVLQQPSGAFAGLLRLINNEYMDEDSPIKLIAISTGSCSWQDMHKSLEWKVYEFSCDRYDDDSTSKYFQHEPRWISWKEKCAMLFDINLAFCKKAVMKVRFGTELDLMLEEIEQRRIKQVERTPWRAPTNMWFQARNDFLRDYAQYCHAANLEEGVEAGDCSSEFCEFYNVLWIEHKDGITYRRALWMGA